MKPIKYPQSAQQKGKTIRYPRSRKTAPEPVPTLPPIVYPGANPRSALTWLIHCDWNTKINQSVLEKGETQSQRDSRIVRAYPSLRVARESARELVTYALTVLEPINREMAAVTPQIDSHGRWRPGRRFPIDNAYWLSNGRYVHLAFFGLELDQFLRQLIRRQPDMRLMAAGMDLQIFAKLLRALDDYYPLEHRSKESKSPVFAKLPERIEEDKKVCWELRNAREK